MLFPKWLRITLAIRQNFRILIRCLGGMVMSVMDPKVKCPNAEAAYAELLSLPLFPAMTKADVDQVIRALKALDQKPIPPCA